MNTETLTVLPKGEDFEIIVQHDQTGSAYGITLSKNAYEQLRQHFVVDVDTKDNDLLISKAPEMLEMLKKHLSILYDIEMEDSGDNIYVKNLIIETKQLIKQATDL